MKHPSSKAEPLGPPGCSAGGGGCCSASCPGHCCVWPRSHAEGPWWHPGGAGCRMHRVLLEGQFITFGIYLFILLFVVVVLPDGIRLPVNCRFCPWMLIATCWREKTILTSIICQKEEQTSEQKSSWPSSVVLKRTQNVSLVLGFQ